MINTKDRIAHYLQEHTVTFYKVKRGEGLFGIASKYINKAIKSGYINTADINSDSYQIDIITLNNLEVDKIIQAGQELMIPLEDLKIPQNELENFVKGF